MRTPKWLFIIVLVGLTLVSFRAFSEVQILQPNVEQPAASLPASNGSSPTSQPAGLPGVTVLTSINESSWLKPIEMEKGQLNLVAGRSHILRFAKQITRISVSDPEVLDVLILSPTEILLNAKKQGSVNIIAWNEKDQVSVFDVVVTRDPVLLLELLQRIDPQGHFEIYPSEQVFVIKGDTSSVEKATKIEKAANAFAEGSISLVQVKDVKQVLLQIRFIQVDRSQNFEFGVNHEWLRDNPRNNVVQWFLPGGGSDMSTENDSEFTLGSPALTQGVFDSPTDSHIYQATFDSNQDVFTTWINALETKGIAKTIARPNVLAKDGEEASFLVGGEAAVLVQTNNNISVQYKEFGTRMKFKPEMIGDDKIRLTVEPEVSSLNTANGVTTADTSVPGFSTTRVKTVVELKNEETLLVGGLLRQVMEETESGVPFLRRIPWLGRFFESTDKQWEDTELIIVVTPKLIQAEKAPLSEGVDKRDILSVATGFDDYPVPDNRSEAIIQYLSHHKRYLEDSEMQSGTEVQSAQPSGQQGPETKVLDDLEASLKAEQGKQE